MPARVAGGGVTSEDPTAPGFGAPPVTVTPGVPLPPVTVTLRFGLATLGAEASGVFGAGGVIIGLVIGLTPGAPGAPG
jgi:hypothetical protein